MSASFRVRLTDEASKQLKAIARKYGRKTFETLRDLITDLESEPDAKGEALRGVLAGLYSRHYSRFRIIYRIDSDELVVTTLACGFHESRSRKDVYKVLERMIAAGRFAE